MQGKRGAMLVKTLGQLDMLTENREVHGPHQEHADLALMRGDGEEGKREHKKGGHVCSRQHPHPK